MLVCLLSQGGAKLLKETLALSPHTTIGAKNQGRESTLLNFNYSFNVLPFLCRFVRFEDACSRFSFLARGVDMRYTYIKKCCLAPLPETTCLYVQPCIVTTVGSCMCKFLTCHR